MKFVLACDESGAKGYADQDEQYPGQVGVFAGLLVPESVLTQTEVALEKVIAQHRETDGKLHITDLTPEAQAELRKGIYESVSTYHLPCFWYAIHVAGYHAFHNKMSGLLNDAQAHAASLGNRVKTGSPRQTLESLHTELFRGLYGHMIAYIEERSPADVQIEVRTDHVDKPIAKSFRQQAEQMLDDEPRKTVVTGFDAVDNKIVKRELHFATHWPEEFRITTKVDTLSIKPVSDSDPIVVAADVLANSLYHLFRNRGVDDLYTDLNRPSATAKHPLAKSLDTFRNWGGPDLIGDRMFRHPKAAPPRN